MLKYLKRIGLFFSVLSLLEITSIIVMYFLYINNYFSLQDSITIQIVFYCLVGSLGLNIILFFVFYLIIYKIRLKGDLTTEDLFGKNIQESFEFSRLGMIVVDDSKIVLWNNETMNRINPNLIDQNVLDVFPALRDFQNARDESKYVKVLYNNKSFNVSFIKTANTYFFYDTTEYDNLSDYSKEQQMVLGIIMIDNLAEFGGDEEGASSDLIASVRTKIIEYFKSYGVLLRRFKSDSYFAVCNYVSLTKIEDDSFGILDVVRAISNDDNVSLTLSIGFAHDYPGPYKLNEKANDALEMAVSRGGDQVVVDCNGVDLKFFGGKSEAIEKKNKIKVRLISNSFVSVLRNAPNVLIMGHVDADLDSIGACLGVKSICNALNVESKVIYDFKLVEKKTRLAISSVFSKEEYNDIFINYKDAMAYITNKTLLVCCDFHRESLAMSQDIIEHCSKIAIIDHHRRSEEFINSPIFTYIEASASSACELVTELISFSPVNPPISIPKNYATIMLSGIFVDTNFYRSTLTGARTFEASMILRRFGADNIMADNFLKDDLEEKMLVTKILNTLEMPYPGISLCLAPEDMNIDRVILSKVANECLSMKGVNACFVIGRVEQNETRVSARSDGTINVQIICEKIGSGGGHFSMAASSIKDVTVSQTKDMVLNVLKDNLEDAKSSAEHGQ